MNYPLIFTPIIGYYAPGGFGNPSAPATVATLQCDRRVYCSITREMIPHESLLLFYFGFGYKDFLNISKNVRVFLILYPFFFID